MLGSVHSNTFSTRRFGWEFRTMSNSNLAIANQSFQNIFVTYGQYLPFTTTIGVPTEYKVVNTYWQDEDFVLVIENKLWGKGRIILRTLRTAFSNAIECTAPDFTWGEIDSGFIRKSEKEWVAYWTKGSGMFSQKGEIKLYFK